MGWGRAGEGAFCCLPVSLLLVKLNCNISNCLHPRQQTVELQSFTSNGVVCSVCRFILNTNSTGGNHRKIPRLLIKAPLGPYRHHPLALPPFPKLGALTPLGLSQFRLPVNNDPRPLGLLVLNSSASQYPLHSSRSSSNPSSPMKTFQTTHDNYLLF